MTNSRSPRSLRQGELLSFVSRVGTATSTELSEFAQVSLMTIHRDIDELAGKGLLRKFHGGVSALPTSVFESGSEFRLRVNSRDKEAMAKKAVEQLEPGMAIYLDDSSSSHFVARELAGRGEFTIVTNYLPTLNLLSGEEDIQLVAIGGDFSRKHEGFAGEAAVEALRRVHVDVSFMSVSAMTVDMTFQQGQASVQMKRPVLEMSTRAMLLMDSSKIARTALYRVAPTAAFHAVVLGPGVPADFASDLAQRTLVLAAEPPARPLGS